MCVPFTVNRRVLVWVVALLAVVTYVFRSRFFFSIPTIQARSSTLLKEVQGTAAVILTQSVVETSFTVTNGPDHQGNVEAGPGVSKKSDIHIVEAPKDRYPDVPITLLSTDAHISLIADIKDLVKRHFPNITIRDESLSGHCHQMGTCAQNIQVLNRENPGANIYTNKEVKRRFFEHYKEGTSTNDTFVLTSDVAHCSHPTGMCEFYMPFNKSVILWASTRFEQGREGNPTLFSGFVKNFRAMAAKPGNAVMANSVYDQMYVYYFTGIKPEYVPSYCAYPGVTSKWDGIKEGNAASKVILAHGYRPKFGNPGSMENLMSPLLTLLQLRQSKYEIKALRAVYSHYSYGDLANHPAILYFPYQVSVMSFFEQYRMAIPLIVPGIKLLTQWQLTYGMLSERTWHMVFTGGRPVGSCIPKHPDAAEIPYDPNDEINEEAVAYWLQFSDFYTFPHVLTFESWEELADIIMTTDFKRQSQLMVEANKQIEIGIVQKWAKVFSNVIPQHTRPSLKGLPYDQAMDAIYGAGNWSDY